MVRTQSPLPFASALLALLSLAAAPGAHAAQPKNAILLSQVQSLTLRAGQATSHRRVAAAPQLKCVSAGPVCALHAVDTMRCVNQGAGYAAEDIQWSCTASLPPELKLGATDVVCEGYASPDDPYVLKGSCGVEYRLILTDEGERRYPEIANGGGWGWGGGGKKKQKPAAGSGSGAGETDWSGVLFMIVFVAVLAWIVYGACVAAGGNGPNRRPATRRPRNGGGTGGWGPGGGGGGGGPWGDDDPPPPYPGSGSKPSSSSRQQEGWRPGFWSGAASGAAAGYFAGQRGSRQQPRQQDYGSGWGGGSSGGWGGSSAGSSSSGSSSGARHESTGFGGTSRR
ncbi:hypothetical protein JX265_007613 [Neoarthrinium moseri]|uniref:Store-operated calcium entry-associated regulatory factor n=1 Tax=Neoarthrinium moseri TaxID=1658444 RepID=A0A9P9WJU6_9PEZI|nr:hypothetical protein JX266_000637 [Neoarthrinium moseri]KAI1867037.1 hypothetical protein JX265_007613 [Neoarthrinium moseri]